MLATCDQYHDTIPQNGAASQISDQVNTLSAGISDSDAQCCGGAIEVPGINPTAQDADRRESHGGNLSASDCRHRAGSAGYPPWVSHSSLRPRMQEVATFGVVGALAFVIDVGGFNLLVHIPDAPLSEKPLTAKVISTSLAIIWAYVGNREWTWRHRERRRVRSEFSIFVLLNVIAMGIAVATLGISRYGLGLESALADNISANVIGVGLGTLFRFWSYQRWVFRR